MKLTSDIIEDIYALTPVQEGMLFHYLKNDDSEYNEQLILNIDGEVDYDSFVRTWKFIVDRHAALRTVFRWQETKQHLQIVLKSTGINTGYFDLSNETDKFDKYEQYCKADLVTRFDLDKEAIRFSLYKLEEKRYSIVVTNHHIIYDGWSNGILINEFLKIYKAISENIKIENLPDYMPYKSYIAWLKKRDQEKDKLYWKAYLENYQPYLQKRHSRNEGTEDYIYIIEKDKFINFAKENDITLATLINTAWGIVMQKIDRRNDVVFGTTVAGRNIFIPGIENTVGLFINTIPLRIISLPEMSVIDLLKAVMQDTSKREQHEHTPITEVKKASGIGAENDLFNTIVVIENYPLSHDLEEGGLRVTDYQSFESNNYDITVGIEISNKLKIVLSYQRNVYSDIQIKSIERAFENILYSMIDNPAQKISALEMLSVEDKHEMLSKAGLKKEYELKHGTVAEMLTSVYKKYPNNVAVKCGDKVLTYMELDHRSNQLASWLLKHKIGKNDVVAALMEASIEMVIAVNAIIKAGAAFTLIDADMPYSRIDYILKDCKARMLITDQEDVKFDIEKLVFDKNSKLEESTESISIKIEPSQLLYVIYTSGTTGIPQGVMIEHRNLVTYIEAVSKLLNINQKDSTIKLCAVTFDTFIDEMFLALLNGGKFVLPEKEQMKNIEMLYGLIREDKVTILSCVPMIINIFNRMPPLKDVRIVISGGDVLKYEHISNMISYSDIYNSYGPSEATIAPIYYKVKKDTDKTIPIGTVLEGCTAYILDKDKKLCSYGITGELYLGGGSISRGYLNNKELTIERFIKINVSGAEEVLYKTGDLAILLEAGNIDFVGRDDGQVKVNGVRIELRDIEMQIRKNPKVLDAVVDSKKDSNGRQYLCAYFVAHGDITSNELRLFVKELLPGNMLPAYWIRLDKIPETRHGKIDYNALHQYFINSINEKNSHVENPANEAEEKLLNIWREVLDKKDLGVTDDFFEVGGDSLQLTSVYSRMNQQFDEKVTVQNLFDYRTIREMVTYLDGKSCKNSQEPNIKLIDF